MARAGRAPGIQTSIFASQNAIFPCSRHPHRRTSTTCSPFTAPAFANEAITMWSFAVCF